MGKEGESQKCDFALFLSEEW